MKLILNILLILTFFVTFFAEDLHFKLRPPRAGEMMLITARVRYAFEFDRQNALSDIRKNAIAQYTPIYTYLPDRFRQARAKTRDLSEMIGVFRSRGKDGNKGLAAYLKLKFNVTVTPAAASEIIQYKNLKNLLDGILTVQESIFQNKIVPAETDLTGKEYVEIAAPNPGGFTRYHADDLMSLTEARSTMLIRIKKLFWQVDPEVLAPVLKIAAASLVPNLMYNHLKNNQRIEKILQRYPTQAIAYRPGQILAPFRHVLAPDDVLRINAYRRTVHQQLHANIAWVVLTVILTLILFNTVLARTAGAAPRGRSQLSLFTAVLIIMLMVGCGLLWLTPLPVYGLPIGLLPLLLCFLKRERMAALWAGVTGAVLLSLLIGPTYEILLYLLFGAVTAALAGCGIKKRIAVLRPALIVAAVNAVLVVALSLDINVFVMLSRGLLNVQTSTLKDTFSPQMLATVGWAFAGGFAAAPLTLLLLPLLERGWQTASSSKLKRYTDLQHPLLRELQAKTPGTYQHTMTVAYLAQTVGEALGADILLLRVGAYYHDIGKIKQPQLFIENQNKGQNPHDTLKPIKSARIIFDHVTQGLRIGRAAGLPEAVLAMIQQHHGTQCIEFFYDKACKDDPGSFPDQTTYRYAGPKPQTNEAAILMIADAVEAASRTIENSRAKIEKMVRLIVEKRVADGQFDQCDLTTRDLPVIINVLVDALKATLHTRVAYPWQKDEQPQQDKEWTV